MLRAKLPKVLILLSRNLEKLWTILSQMNLRKKSVPESRRQKKVLLLWLKKSKKIQLCRKWKVELKMSLRILRNQNLLERFKEEILINKLKKTMPIMNSIWASKTLSKMLTITQHKKQLRMEILKHFNFNKYYIKF